MTHDDLTNLVDGLDDDGFQDLVGVVARRIEREHVPGPHVDLTAEEQAELDRIEAASRLRFRKPPLSRTIAS